MRRFVLCHLPILVLASRYETIQRNACNTGLLLDEGRNTHRSSLDECLDWYAASKVAASLLGSCKNRLDNGVRDGKVQPRRKPRGATGYSSGLRQCMALSNAVELVRSFLLDALATLFNLMTTLQMPTFRALVSHDDERGGLTEIFRDDWAQGQVPVQWNFVRTRPNTLRGVHVHVRHVDHLIVLRGTMLLGICDLREAAPAFLESSMVELSGDKLTLATIPTGIAHGFYFPEATDYVYAVTHYWDPINDELGCAWNDPGLSLDWPVCAPVLSDRDRAAPPLAILLNTLKSMGVRSC